jgi:hypothetical protein
MMPIQTSLHSPVPGATLRAMADQPGESLYRAIGDELEQLLADIDLAGLDPAGKRSAATLAALALATIFQFAENLPDRRAAEATRTRPDWRYALRLARTHPGLDHRSLCEFRRQLWHEPAARQTFQQVLDRLVGADLLSGADRQPLIAGEVLATVCRVNRLGQLIEAMRMLLEAMAAVEPEALRTITLPHWYERYGRIQAERDLPKSQEEQTALAQAIGGDALYLLEVVAKASADLGSLPEARVLQQMWLLQFDQAEHQIQWHTPVCALCSVL